MFIVNLRYFIGSLLFSMYVCLPPHKRLSDDEYEKLINEEQNNNNRDGAPSLSLEQLGIEYTRYLQQVIETLEKDESFRKKLEVAEDSDIKSAKIAEELEYVNHNVRSKLDELKRTELQRLRELAKQAYSIDNNNIHVRPPGHIDHDNPNTFEIKDLKKLIQKVAEDLEEADKKRKKMFKSYEMQKHFEREEKLKTMNDEERKIFLLEEEAKKKKEKEGKKRVHHPGSKQQLEEVWEEQDHMNKNDFDPRTFFYMHDVDGNGFLDEEEVKTLFLKELDKLYAQGMPQSDLMERAEEMERMREHVFAEVDKNKDRLISWEEFYAMSLRPEFNQDPGWQPLDEQQIYTPEELEAFERQRLAEIEQLKTNNHIKNLGHQNNIQANEYTHHNYDGNAVPAAQYNYQQNPVQQPHYPPQAAQQQPYLKQQLHHEPQLAQNQLHFNQHPGQQHPPYEPQLVNQKSHFDQLPHYKNNQIKQNVQPNSNNADNNIKPNNLFDVPAAPINQQFQNHEKVDHHKTFSVQPPVANAIPNHPSNKKNSHEQIYEQRPKLFQEKKNLGQ